MAAMSDPHSFPYGTRLRLMDRIHANLAARSRPETAFRFTPEPRIIGSVARGQQLLAGNFMFSGHLIEAPGASIWDAADRVAAQSALGQGFTWLDDLAAVGDNAARHLAQSWLQDWIARSGTGHGQGWTPALTGRRLIRWVAHGFFVLRGADTAFTQSYFRSAAQQTIFLSRRWRSAPDGLPRFEALTGLICAGLSLQGFDGRIRVALAALEKECTKQIGPDTEVAGRNPEQLVELATLLSCVDAALRAAGRDPSLDVTQALDRVVPLVRALCHGDGTLARFHGGGGGFADRVAHVLSLAGRSHRPEDGFYMGFGRLAAGRVTVIMDCAPPPIGAEPHASTLGFELTSGRCPMIVNCGSGRGFGPEWRKAGRATANHSTLVLDGQSSTQFATDRGGVEHVSASPKEVQFELLTEPDSTLLAGAQDGYRAACGLTHARLVGLSRDGRNVEGEDLITTLEEADKPLFDRAMAATGAQGIPWALHFHLHPEVDATIDDDGTACQLTLNSGEVWTFRPSDGVALRLEPTFYLESGQLRPRSSQQVVLSGHAMSYATRIRWSLAKTRSTPVAPRDVEATD